MDGYQVEIFLRYLTLIIVKKKIYIIIILAHAFGIYLVESDQEDYLQGLIRV